MSFPIHYRTAYHGISRQQDGNFSHLNYAIDLSHLHSGYWRFRSVEDDCKAIAYGFETPEMLLVAVDNDDDCEEYEDITIVWIKGTEDPILRGNISGTASQHLWIIYEIRDFVGLPMSSRGQTPTYAISTHPRMKAYWDMMYDSQSTTPTFRPFKVVDMETLLPAPPPPRIPELPRPHHLQYVARGRARHRYMNPECAREGLSLLQTSATNFHTTTTRQPRDPSQLATLPCMSCGNDNGHKHDCPLGSRYCNEQCGCLMLIDSDLSFKNHLTILDYRILTDAVSQFDPGPWTAHFDQFPEAEPEDAQTQIAGIAKVIRNEDSYKNDVTLHGLRDDCMIMLWALKTSAGVEVVDEQTEFR